MGTVTTAEKHRRTLVRPSQLQFSKKSRCTIANRTCFRCCSPRLYMTMVKCLDIATFGSKGRGKCVRFGGSLRGRGPLVSENRQHIDLDRRCETHLDSASGNTGIRCSALRVQLCPVSRHSLCKRVVCRLKTYL